MLIPLAVKVVRAYTHIVHCRIEKKYRYYISDNCFARLYQIRFLAHDHFLKRKYKRVDYQGEFQQELCFVLPFAYWHYLNGTLKASASCKNTKELYFFSPDHKEAYDKRIWQYNSKNFEFPNMTHCLTLSKKKWAPVPLKKQYRNSRFVFDKPTLVIANKYNIEWNNQPLNYLEPTVLEYIFEKFKNKYQIVYNRPQVNEIVADNSDILDLNEFDWIRTKYPEVLLMQDLYREHAATVNNFNHLQLLVYANCEHFISVHGGTAALCSYFGGKNLIFSRSGIEHVFGEFFTVFPSLSGAQILLAKTTDEIVSLLQAY